MAGKTRVFEPSRSHWLITFADMATLLLALFVLIFSMSSVDTAFLESFSAGLDNQEYRNKSRGVQTPERLRLAASLLADTANLRQQENRIKELLFLPEVLPPGLDKGTIDQLVRIFDHKDGVLFMLDNALLFSPGGSELTPAGRALLLSLVPLPDLLPGSISISGHEDPRAAALDGLPGQDPYLASSRRALTALGVFLGRGCPPARFSVGAYGWDQAPEIPPGFGPEAGTPAGGRLEILWKTR